MTDRHEEDPTVDERSQEGPPDSRGEESAKSPDELRQEIRKTREELGDTVDAISEKADMTGRAKGAIDEQKQKLREKREVLKRKVSSAGGGSGAEAGDQMKSALDRLAARTRRQPLRYLGAAAVVGLLLGRAMRRD